MWSIKYVLPVLLSVISSATVGSFIKCSCPPAWLQVLSWRPRWRWRSATSWSPSPHTSPRLSVSWWFSRETTTSTPRIQPAPRPHASALHPRPRRATQSWATQAKPMRLLSMDPSATLLRLARYSSDQVWLAYSEATKQLLNWSAVCLCSPLSRMQWRSIMKTTHPSSPSAASLVPLRCLTGATLQWKKPSTWGTPEPFWRAPFHVMITSVSQTAASHLSSPSRFVSSRHPTSVIWAFKVSLIIISILLTRLSSLPRPKTFTIGMRLETSPPPTCRFWMTQWR